METEHDRPVHLVLPIEGAELRAWHVDDRASLVHHANNRAVARQLRDRFPHPYEVSHGMGFLQWASQQPVGTLWAIAVHGAAVGGIGLQFGQDIDRVSAEVGYWLGEEYWGRGLATAALRSMTDHAFAHFELTRIFAVPFASNLPSIRVLEKAGYALEGHLLRSAIKDGVICDQCLYARYKA